jgi:hypothetical protein
MLAEYAMKELQLSQTAMVPEANTPGGHSQRRQSLFSAAQSVDGSNSVLSGRRSVATAESVDPSFKPKIYYHSYKLAQRKERRELEQVSQIVQEKQTKSLEFQQQKEEEQKLEEGRGRNNLYKRSNRSVSQPLQGQTREPNSVSSSVERKVEGTDNKMHISEFGNEDKADNGNDENSTNLQFSELNESGLSHNESDLGASFATLRPLGEPSQAPSTNASRLADKLIARGMLIKKKKEQQAEQLKEQEIAGCTFKPKIKILRSKAKQPSVSSDVSAIEEPIVTIDQERIDKDREIRRQQRREEKRRQKLLARHIAGDQRSVPERKEDLSNSTVQQVIANTGPPPSTDGMDGTGTTRRGSIAAAMGALLAPPANNTVGQSGVVDKPLQNDQEKDVLSSCSDDDDSSSSSIPPPPPPPPSSSSSIMPPPNTPVYERLYALKDKKPVIVPMHLNPKFEQEMEGCTFHPHIERRPTNLNQHSTQEILAYDKTVNRMREINAAKQKRKEEEENAWKEVDERYKRSRALLVKEGPKPFQFHSEKRLKEIAEKARVKAQDKTDLIVEVKLSAAKSARIIVGHNEDPLSAVQKFAKIYGLEAEAVQVLLTVVHQAIQARADAITRAQAEAEEAERRLREEEARLAAEAAAAATLKAEELALRQQQMAEQLGKHRKRSGKIPQHRVVNEHGEDVFLEDEQDDDADDGDDFENDFHPEESSLITGYDNYRNPIYAAGEHHRQLHNLNHHHHHGHHPRTYSRDHHSPHSSNGYHQHGQQHGYAAPHGMMALSDEMDMIPVEDEYSSYTGTSSDLSDYDDDHDDDDDDDYDSDDDEDETNSDEGGSAGNEGKKQRPRRRRDSSKRPSILSQFF